MDQLSSYDEKEVMKKKKDKINEILKRDIFRVIKSFRKFHNIIVYIRSSVSRTKEFKNLVKRIILFDNRTKWTS
jgi:hypothetical protein